MQMHFNHMKCLRVESGGRSGDRPNICEIERKIWNAMRELLLAIIDLDVISTQSAFYLRNSGNSYHQK